MAKPGGRGLLDLEGHYALYGAYHRNPVNVSIHEVFVWPIFLMLLMLLHLTAPFAHAAAVYAAYYFLLDRRAGKLAALLCYLCWAASGALAPPLVSPLDGRLYSWLSWSVRLCNPLVLEFSRSERPLSLTPLSRLLMAPFFVLLEILHTFGGYEPYPGFHDKVSKLIGEARKEWDDMKSKKSS